MHELMLFAGGRGRHFPDSGPGSKYAVGNEELGYFGEVTCRELFTTSELLQQLELKQGTIATTEPTWLKFYRRGQVLYIPMTCLVTGVSWEALYYAGLVYGVNGSGPLGELLPVLPTDQIRLVEKDEFIFRVRLMRDAPEVDHDEPSVSTEDDPLRDSEFNALLYRVSKLYRDKTERPLPSWDKYTTAELDLNTSMWVREVWSLRREQPWIRSLNGYPLARTRRTNDSVFGWRPVLEMDLGDELYSQIRHSYQTDTDLRAVGGIQTKSYASGLVPIASTTISFGSEPLLSQIRHSSSLEGGLLKVGGIQTQSGKGLLPLMITSVRVTPDPTSGLVLPVRLRQSADSLRVAAGIKHRIQPMAVKPISSVSISFTE